MNDSLVKDTAHGLSCVLCGETEALRKRFVACGLSTCWNRHQNGQDRQVFTQDDVRVCELVLCGNCLDKQYHMHLDRHNSNATAWLSAVVGFVLAGILASLNAQYQWLPMPDGAMHHFAALILAVATTALLIGGVIALLLLPQAISEKLRWTRISAAQHTDDSLADQAINDAFVEAGKAVLEGAAREMDPTSDPTPPNVPALGKFVPRSVYPAKKGDEGIYRVKHYSADVLRAADHADETIPCDWAPRYLELGRVTDEARFASAYDRQSVRLGTWFLYFAILIAVLLVASAFSWKGGFETTAFLLVIPVAFIAAVGAIIAWCVEASTAWDYKKMFGRLRGFTTAKRFLARTIAGILLIVASAGYMAHSRSVYIATHPLELYKTPDVTFGSPREWRKLSNEETDRIESLYKGILLGAFEPEKGALFMITSESSSINPSGLLQERRKQIDDLIAKGDVTQVHRLEITETNGRPAVYLDVDRRNAGRGRKVDIRMDRTWVGVSLILPHGGIEKYEEVFNAILNSVK